MIASLLQGKALTLGRDDIFAEIQGQGKGCSLSLKERHVKI